MSCFARTWLLHVDVLGLMYFSSVQLRKVPNTLHVHCISVHNIFTKIIFVCLLINSVGPCQATKKYIKSLVLSDLWVGGCVLCSSLNKCFLTIRNAPPGPGAAAWQYSYSCIARCSSNTNLSHHRNPARVRLLRPGYLPERGVYGWWCIFQLGWFD